MPWKDPPDFLDPVKLEALTRQVGAIVHAVSSLRIDAGVVIRDDCKLQDPDRLRRRARVARWHQLYPVRELVFANVEALRLAAVRLEAEWGRTEESLCALGDRKRRHG